MSYVRSKSKSFKYHRFPPRGCKDNGIGKCTFIAIISGKFTLIAMISGKAEKIFQFR